MAESRSYNIVPLKGSSNYATWKLQVKMALKEKNLWDIVEGTEVLAQGANQNAQNDFKRRTDKALCTIVLNIDPSQLWIVGEDPQDPTAVWKKLQDQFQKKTWANKMSLRKRLYTAKLKNGESASEHIRMMTEVFNELAVVGDPVGEADQVIYLLAGLPESYDMLVTAFETMETVPNWETVVERVCDQEKKKGEKSQEKALTSWSK